MKRFNLLVLLALTAGCGASTPDPGTEQAIGVVPTLPTLQGISIDAGAGGLFVGETLTLTALGTYSNGFVFEVPAYWTSLQPAFLSLGATEGVSVVATALSAGLAGIQASFEGKSAQILVNVQRRPPQDPGPIYGAGEGNGEIYRYDGVGTSGTRLYTLSASSSAGLALSRDGATLYAVDSLFGLYKYDLGNDSAAEDAVDEQLADLFRDPNVNWAGVECDSAGRILIQGWGQDGTHRLVRYTPSNGQLEDLAPIGRPTQMRDLAIGPDDDLYFGPFVVGTDLVYRHRPGSGSAPVWAAAPADLSTLQVTCGIAVNARGEAVTGGMRGGNLYRCIDVNSDGDALDANERSIYATVPYVDAGYSVTDISATRGSGFLINVRQPATPAADFQGGIYWLEDLDGNGVVTRDEMTLYSAAWLRNGNGRGNLAARLR